MTPLNSTQITELKAMLSSSFPQEAADSDFESIINALNAPSSTYVWRDYVAVADMVKTNAFNWQNIVDMPDNLYRIVDILVKIGVVHPELTSTQQAMQLLFNAIPYQLCARKATVFEAHFADKTNGTGELNSPALATVSWNVNISDILKALSE